MSTLLFKKKTSQFLRFGFLLFPIAVLMLGLKADICFGQKQELKPALNAGQRKRSPHSFGILVFYKAKLTEKEAAAIDNLKLRLHLKREKKFSYFNLDVLSSTQTETLTPAQVEDLCRHFLPLSWVEKCVADIESPPASDTEPVHHANTNNSCLLKPETLSPSAQDWIQTLANAANAEACPLLETGERAPKLDGTLSPLWAQEYIGADLAKEALGQIAPEAQVPFAVFDAFNPGFDHGRHCSSLASGTTPFSASEVGRAVEFTTGFTSQYVAATEEILSQADHLQSQLPKLVTNSRLWMRPEVSQVIARLTERGTLLVTAAGNDFPVLVQEIKEHFDSAIIVGSASPFGTPSSFSSESRKISVLAPSDEYLESAAGPFAGTSGATPLVAGALLNVLALLPDLKHSEAKILIERTANPTLPRNDALQFNGVGLLNSYKLVRVAEKISAQCKKPETRPDCIHRLILDPETYKFSAEKNQHSLLQEVALQFPGCGLPETLVKQAASSCKRKQVVLKKLRQAAFLSEPESAEARQWWNAVSCVHRQVGLKTNADFYATLANQGPSQDLLARAAEGKVIDEKLSASILRGMRPDFSKNTEWLNRVLKDPKAGKKLKAAAAVMLSHVGTQGFPFIEQALQDADPKVRVAAADALAYFGKDAIPSLERALNDPAREVRAIAIINAPRAGEKVIPLLERSLEDSDKMNRIYARDSLQEFADRGIALQDDVLAKMRQVARQP